MRPRLSRLGCDVRPSRAGRIATGITGWPRPPGRSPGASASATAVAAARSSRRRTGNRARRPPRRVDRPLARPERRRRAARAAPGAPRRVHPLPPAPDQRHGHRRPSGASASAADGGRASPRPTGCTRSHEATNTTSDVARSHRGSAASAVTTPPSGPSPRVRRSGTTSSPARRRAPRGVAADRHAPRRRPPPRSGVGHPDGHRLRRRPRAGPCRCPSAGWPRRTARRRRRRPGAPGVGHVSRRRRSVAVDAPALAVRSATASARSARNSVGHRDVRRRHHDVEAALLAVEVPAPVVHHVGHRRRCRAALVGRRTPRPPGTGSPVTRSPSMASTPVREAAGRRPAPRRPGAGSRRRRGA